MHSVRSPSLGGFRGRHSAWQAQGLRVSAVGDGEMASLEKGMGRAPGDVCRSCVGRSQ